MVAAVRSGREQKEEREMGDGRIQALSLAIISSIFFLASKIIKFRRSLALIIKLALSFL